MNMLTDTAAPVQRLRHPSECGAVKPGHAWILAALAVALVAGAVFRFGDPGGGSAADGVAAGSREVDFGMVELNPALPMPITSYKHGGNMVVYAGEELRFQVLGDAPLPTIELRAGGATQVLQGSDGQVKVDGPAGKPLPAVMFAQGERLSLPGGAPPRVSVKVQVHGGERPK
jgi:hypothetical protein